MNLAELLVLLGIQILREQFREARGDLGIQSDYALCAGDKR